MSWHPLLPKAALSVRLARQHRIAIWSGAAGSGKTVVSAVAFAEALHALTPTPGELVVIIGVTGDTIRDNVIEPLQMIYGDRVRVTADRLFMFGHEVRLLGAPNVRAMSRLRGKTIRLMLIDEASQIDPAIFAEALRRLRTPGARLLATTNPEGPRHWLKIEWIDRARTVLRRDGRWSSQQPGDPAPHDRDGRDCLDLAYFRFTMDDNPALTELTKQNMRTEQTGVWYARMVEGEWAAGSDTIWPLDPAKHLHDELPRTPAGDLAIIPGSLRVTMDPGSTHPFSALLVGVGSLDGRLWVLSEWRWDSTRERRSLAPSEMAAALDAWADSGFAGVLPPGQRIGSGGVKAVIDPAAKWMRDELQKTGHGYAQAADKEVLKGIKWVSTLAATDRLAFYKPLTKDVWAESLGYLWDVKAAEQGDDRPVKLLDDGPDALRYGAMDVMVVVRRAWPVAEARHAAAARAAAA